PTPATAYARIGDQLVVVSATAMAPEKGSPPIDWKRPAVLLFMRAIDGAFLSALADMAGVSALREGAIGERAAGSNVALPGPAGEDVAALVWRFRPPSTVILARLWPAGLAILAVMFLTGGFITRRLLRMTARYQRERERREQQLSLTMMEAREANHAKS